MGCGIAALAFVVLIFAGSAIVSATGGVNKIFAMMIDVTHQQLSPMYAKDVAPAKRKEVDAAIDGISKDLGNGRVGLQQVQPLLEAMKDAVADQTVTNPECDTLLKACADARKPKTKS